MEKNYYPFSSTPFHLSWNGLTGGGGGGGGNHSPASHSSSPLSTFHAANLYHHHHQQQQQHRYRSPKFNYNNRRRNPSFHYPSHYPPPPPPHALYGLNPLPPPQPPPPPFAGSTTTVVTAQLSAKIQELGNRLHCWKAVSIGLSFLALILLLCKLYDVDREISYLQFVSTEWLSPLAVHQNLLNDFPPSGSVAAESSESSHEIISSPTSHNLYSLNASMGDGRHFRQVRNNHRAPTQAALSDSVSAGHISTGQPETRPTSLPANSIRPNPSIQQIITVVEHLRDDIEVLLVELWSSRTTLLLSLVFIFVYIVSWCWMAYAIRETTTPQDVSLKTVLLLAIFAAVDIAASAGFVMVRVIMYVMRDQYFPRDMRTPALTAEFNQLAAYSALRLITLKSSTGVVDIFVSVIVAFLTSLRVYSVICAVSFYRRARKELMNVNNFEYMMEKSRHGYGGRLEHHHHHPTTQSQPPPPPHQSAHQHSPNQSKGSPTVVGKSSDDSYLPKVRLLSAHKDLERRFSLGGAADVSDASSEDDPTTELKIQAADMTPSIQKAAMQATIHALKTYSTEKHIAESIKQNFDQLYEPTWHCIVGRNWGSCVTHTKSNYIRMLYKDLTILLYKSS